MSAPNKPIAVLISDIHFSVATLELASQSLLQAQSKAKELSVPLVIAGDLLDSKAIIRAECANRLLDIFSSKDAPPTAILVGNHDLINEKGKEHSLNFLKHRCIIVDYPQQSCLSGKDVLLIPYQSDPEAMKAALSWENPPDTIICHQGIQSAFMGHYVQDKTSLPKESFKDYRVISGHYHRAQDIKCGRPRKGAVGLFSYIGTPYTTSFAEAEDGPKGFQILYDNGLLELVPTNLRKHVILERRIDNVNTPVDGINLGDLIWLKVLGSHSELEKLKKQDTGMKLFGHNNFKLDKIYTDSPKLETKKERLTGPELMDTIIDATDEKLEEKAYLKSLWREIL